MTSVALNFGDLIAIVGDSITVVALALFGGFALLNPDRLQSYFRGLFERQGLIRMWPFSGLVLRPWYVVWLRVGGLLVSVFAAMGAYAIWLHLHH